MDGTGKRSGVLRILGSGKISVAFAVKLQGSTKQVGKPPLVLCPSEKTQVYAPHNTYEGECLEKKIHFTQTKPQ